MTKPFARDVFRCAVLGLFAGLAWALFHWFFGFPMNLMIAALVVFPFFEESIRLAALIIWRASRGTAIYSGAAFGAGFGLVEAGLRWWDAISGVGSTILGIVAPIGPLFMHIFLGILAWKFISANKPAMGFILCLAVHVLHNGIGVQIIWSGPSLSVALLIACLQIFLYGAATFLLARAVRRRIPADGGVS